MKLKCFSHQVSILDFLGFAAIWIKRESGNDVIIVDHMLHLEFVNNVRKIYMKQRKSASDFSFLG